MFGAVCEVDNSGDVLIVEYVIDREGIVLLTYVACHFSRAKRAPPKGRYVTCSPNHVLSRRCGRACFTTETLATASERAMVRVT